MLSWPCTCALSLSTHCKSVVWVRKAVKSLQIQTWCQATPPAYLGNGFVQRRVAICILQAGVRASLEPAQTWQHDFFAHKGSAGLQYGELRHLDVDNMHQSFGTTFEILALRSMQAICVLAVRSQCFCDGRLPHVGSSVQRSCAPGLCRPVDICPCTCAPFTLQLKEPQWACLACEQPPVKHLRQ